MVTIETTADRTNGITRVRAIVTNTHATPQTVRLRCCLESPVWVPRRDGVVDPRWDDESGIWEATIRPNRSRGVGFAGPTPPSEPLVDVLSSERCGVGDAGRSAGAVLADLDGWSPTSAILEGERERDS